MNVLERQVRELVDREEIRELTARYAHGIALGDGAAVADLFTDDGVFINRMDENDGSLPSVLRGRKALEEFYRTVEPNVALPCVHNHVIVLDGDEAAGTCSLEVRLAIGGRSMIGAGYYNDRFRRENGRWKFSERQCTFFHFVPVEQGWA